MKRIFIPLIGLFLVATFCFCHSNSGKKIDAEQYLKFQQTGNKISNIAQGVLLSNVGKAMKNGGTKNAVTFCNLEASSIIDSLNTANNCSISRISAKNRNPGNSPKNNTDKQIWDFYSSILSEGISEDTVIASKQEFIYYKPIKIAMSACLKCHGIPGQDIDNETYKELQRLYPNDLATGYQLEDFRGLWKISFQKEMN